MAQPGVRVGRLHKCMAHLGGRAGPLRGLLAGFGDGAGLLRGLLAGFGDGAGLLRGLLAGFGDGAGLLRQGWAGLCRRGPRTPAWCATAARPAWALVPRAGTARRGRAAAAAAEPALQVAESQEQVVDRHERRPPREADERHLERSARLPTAHDVVERLGETLVEPHEIVGVGSGGERPHVRDLFRREVEELLGLLADLGDGEIAELREDVLGDVRDVVPLGRELADDAHARPGIAVHERAREAVEDLTIRDAEHARDALGGELVTGRADPGDDLIEQAHRVAHAARCLARDRRDGGVLGGDLLLHEHPLEARRDRLRADELEVVTLAPRQDGDGDLVHLRRREDELHVGRRLLQRLEERVPRVHAEHVDLVHDEDLEPVALRPVRHALLELADVVDARVARAVDLLDVDVAAVRDLDARGAHLAGRGRRPLLAVERLGEDAGARRLADAPDPGEEERVRDAVLRDRVRDRRRHVLLSDEILERLRPPLAREHDVAHAAGVAETRRGRLPCPGDSRTVTPSGFDRAPGPTNCVAPLFDPASTRKNCVAPPVRTGLRPYQLPRTPVRTGSVMV